MLPPVGGLTSLVHGMHQNAQSNTSRYGELAAGFLKNRFGDNGQGEAQCTELADLTLLYSLGCHKLAS